MIFTYNKTEKKIKALSETDFKTHKILERQDIEKWVEFNPDLLGEDLYILTTEYDRFDKTNERLDLLAIDKDGTLAVIELKRDTSGKNIELQALKYAAYCSTLTLEDVVKINTEYLQKKGQNTTYKQVKDNILAFITNDDFEELSDKPRIILVAKEYTPEVTASVLWLRKFGIDISCIKFRPFEMDEQTIVFESSIIIPLPEAEDYIIQAEKKENIENSKTRTQNEYYSFFSELRDGIQSTLNLHLSTSTTRSYYQIPTGIGGIHFEFCFHGRPRSSFGVELHFEKGDRARNHQLFNKFLKLKDSIEKATNEKLKYQEFWGSTCSRIYLEMAEGQMTEELKKWAIEKMVILYKLLKSEIDNEKEI